MTTYVTGTGSGFWNDPNHWVPKGIPGAGDRAEIYGRTYVTGDQSAASTTLFRDAELRFDGGTLHSSAYGQLSTTSFSVTENGGSATSIQLGYGFIGPGAAFTVDSHLITHKGLEVRSSVLTLSRLLAGDVSFFNSSLILTANTSFGGGSYGPAVFTLSDSAANVIKASAAGVVFTNASVIKGAGSIGAGTMSVVNGTKFADGRGTIQATEGNALIIDSGVSGVVKNLAGSVMEAIFDSRLEIKSSNPGNNDLDNEGIIRARGRGHVKLSQIDIINQGTTETPALMQASDRGTLELDQLEVKNTNGKVVVDGAGTLRMNNAVIRGGEVTVDGNLIVTGQSAINRATFNSGGRVQVEAGAKLAVASTVPSTLAEASVLGVLGFSQDLTLTGGRKVEVAAGGRLEVSYPTLTNVDEHLTGAGTVFAPNIVNEAQGRIDGSLTLEMGPLPENAGTLINRGSISGARINARTVTNAGTMTGIAFAFPYFVNPRGDIDNSGTILNSSFGQGVLITNKGGVVGARGEGGETTFAGTTLIGGTLSTSDHGTIVVKAAPVATRLDPVAVVADTSIEVADGATLEFGSTLDVLDGVHFLVRGETKDTTLKLIDPSVTLRNQSSVFLGGAEHSKLLIGSLTNEFGSLKGGGTIGELTPDTRSLLNNKVLGKIDATFGMGSLTITVDRLINDGLLRADNATLTLHVTGAIQGAGEALVRRGGKIDMSEARQYLGSFRYEGPGTILGPDLVPAGTISGFATGDTYIFGKTNTLEGELTTRWTANAAGTGGTLTVLTKGGETYANLVLAGKHYASEDFAVQQRALPDGNHVAVTFVGALHWAEAVTGNWQDAPKWAPTGLFVPGPEDNALIDAVGAAYEVRVTQDTTVRSVAVGGTGALEIQQGTLTSLTGTPLKRANAGMVRVLAGASFTTGGTFQQTADGKIWALSQNARLNIARDGAITGGTVYLRPGGILSATEGTARLANIDISNTGAINVARTRLDAQNVRFHGDGRTTIGAGATLGLLESSINSGTVLLQGTLVAGGTASLKATVDMVGSAARITAEETPGVLANHGTIAGEGRIGGRTLTLVNRNAIVADLGKELRIDTGDNVVSNFGNLFANAGAKLTVSSKLDNQLGVYASDGAVVLEAEVVNSGLLRAGGSEGELQLLRNVANSGAIAALDGGTVKVLRSIDQTADGEIVADEGGSSIDLGPLASITGGKVEFGADSELVVDGGGEANLKTVAMTLVEGANVRVSVGSLVLNGSSISADMRSTVETLGSNASLTLIDTVVNGGKLSVDRSKMQITNAVTLNGTATSLNAGSILAVGSAKLTNAGAVTANEGANRIAGDLLDLDNQGTIKTGTASTAALTIDTEVAQIINTGTIAASVAGSRVTVNTRVLNSLTGQILSGAGTVKLDELYNSAGKVRATPGGTIEIATSVINEAQGLIHADGGTIRLAGPVNNASSTIQATDGGTLIVTDRLSNDGTVQATSGGTITARIDGNARKLLATGAGSELDLTFIGEYGNRRDIIADEQGKVTLETGLTNRGGRLLVQDGGEIEVHGAVGGGTARMSGAEATLDLLGSAVQDTTLQVSFGTASVEHLLLGHAERFVGTVAGFASGDTIDVANIAYDPSQGRYTYDADREQLVVSDGARTATIQLLGQYAANQFAFASDGHGGTLVTGQPASAPDLGALLAAHA
jgi:hypothetical protein